MSFELDFTEDAGLVLDEMERDHTHAKKLKKVRKALGHLQRDPRHPGLHSHAFESLPGPDGEPMWESYIENRTPGAWRLWWYYGPGRNKITIFDIQKHPD